MATRALSRPNHYEILGIDPAATTDEIAGAFARAMTLGMRPMAAVAEMYAAFETLRDPARRRDYDDSLGLNRRAQPEMRPQSYGWAVSVTPEASGAVARSTIPQAPVAGGPKSEPKPGSRAKTEPDPRVAAIAASLRELAEPKPFRTSEPRRAPERQWPPAQDAVDPLIEQILAEGRAEKRRLGYAEPRSTNWKRPAVAAGGLVIGVAVLGAIAGFAARDAEQQLPKPVASVALPAPTESHMADTAAAEPITRPVAELPQVSQQAPVRALSPDTLPTPQASAALRHEAEPATEAQASPPDEIAPAKPASDLAAPEAAAAPSVAAAMPLPNAVIARTIERIGYACGEVASTAAVEGEQGVFKVTCTSGQSYQATPVGGRYHFRRMGSR